MAGVWILDYPNGTKSLHTKQANLFPKLFWGYQRDLRGGKHDFCKLLLHGFESSQRYGDISNSCISLKPAMFVFFWHGLSSGNRLVAWQYFSGGDRGWRSMAFFGQDGSR